MANNSIPVIRVFTLLLFFLSVNVFSQVQNVENISQLRALSPGVANQVNVAGYYISGDDGGGSFFWNAGSRSADNGGTIIIPDSNPRQGRWIRNYGSSDHINVKWFGARGKDNPAHDDRVPLTSAIDYAASSDVKRVYLPVGIYQVSGVIRLDGRHSGIVLEGEIAYKEENYYGNRIINEPHNIHFTFDKKDFRVVDESGSSVIKLIDNAPHNVNSFHLIQVRPRENQILTGLIIRNLALNGNKYGSGLWPDYTRSQRLFYVYYTEGVLDNSKVENVAVYGSLMTGFDFANTGLNGRNLLTYDNEMHGIGLREYVKITEVEAHGNGFAAYLNLVSNASEPPGGYGIDFSGGSDAGVDGFNVHHNWSGIKSASSVRTQMMSGYLINNFYHGYTQTGDNSALRLEIDNVVSEGNGGAGFRIIEGQRIEIGKITARNNGRDNTYGEFPNFFITVDCVIDTLISSGYAQSSHAKYSAWFTGSIDIGHLVIRNNDKPGLYIANDVTINSGHIYDNDNSGIFINGPRTVHITNLSFGSPDDPSPYRQTYRDIFCSGEAILVHSGLDFSNSKVSPNNHIRVNKVIVSSE